MDNTKSCRVSSPDPYRDQAFFCIPFPQTMLCILSSGLGGLWTFYNPLLIKAAQPENLFSLEVFFLYISNLCQSQKVSNSYVFRKQRCSQLQQRKNQLAQKSDVVSFKATFVFSYILTMLTNVLPGVQWIRDMGT